MDVSEFLGGMYLKAVDISQPTPVTIRDASREVVGRGQRQETKVVVYFAEDKRALVLNKTNLSVLVQLFGADTENWKGQQIELYRDSCFFEGRSTDCLRLRAVNSDSATPPPSQSGTPPDSQPGPHVLGDTPSPGTAPPQDPDEDGAGTPW